MDGPKIQESGVPEEGEVDFTSAFLAALMRQMASGVLVVSAVDGRVLFVNEQMEAIWRRSVGAVGEVAAELEGFHPDGSPYSPDDWPLARVLRRGVAVEGEEIEIVRGDGTRGFVRISAGPLAWDAVSPGAVLVTCLDITQERRRYTSRRFLAEAGALLASSLDHVATLRNVARLAVPALADWCTIDLLNEAGGLDRVAIEHVDRRKANAIAQLTRRYPPSMETETWVARVIRTGRPELIPDVSPEILNGFVRTVGRRKLLEELGVSSAMIIPLIARNSPLGAVVFIAGESRRRYTEDDLEVAEELAARAALAVDNARLFDKSRAATEAKSDFLAVMSHELRTPLTAIIGYAELIQLGVPDPVTPRQKEQAERIEVSSRHLLQLIEEILTLVTLESGERRLRQADFSANELLHRAYNIIEPMARAKDLALVVSEADGDPRITSDPDKLLQVLLNLLSNAVKFTARGEIHLNASVDDGCLVLAVSDAGIGMDEEHLRRIFEPFWQVERPITRSAGGTGLGLTISRRLADLLGAEIEVESQVGVGSTFRLRLPLRDSS
jgi:signal transduction histidine kinase